MQITITETAALEFWQPSVQLRFVERGIVPRRILQQLHTSNLGNREWKDVELEIE